MIYLQLLGILAVFASVFYFLGLYRGAIFVPTHMDIVQKMITAAQIRPGEKLADLGSGDGRIVIAAAKAGAYAVGFEINPLLVLWSRYKIRRAGVQDRARVFWKSFWNQSYSDCDVIIVFGIEHIMKRLENKLQSETNAGTRVISYIFSFPSWQGKAKEGIYIYQR